MGLFAPWFLGGLLAVGLPVYLHLLKQHKTVPMPFSSLMFFERRTQSSVKHRRLRFLALLALRAAILILLALMFANPFVRRPQAAGGSGRKLLVLAVDNSFSMRADGRLDRAIEQAMGATSGFRAGDKGQVITFGNGIAQVTQQVSTAADLQAGIRSIKPSDGRSAYGELSRTLRTMAQPGGLPVEAHVFSDMQKTSLPSPFSELGLTQAIKLVLHPLSEKREPNWYVESVSAPPVVYQPNKVRIQAVVAGAGTQAAEVPVTLALNNKDLETKTVKVAPGARATVEFFLPDAAYGFNKGEIRMAPRDKLANDDRQAFAMERKETSKVLFVHDARQARAAGYYRAAMESVPEAGFTVESVTADQATNLSPQKYAFVVLSDLSRVPEPFEQALISYVRGGGAVMIALGPLAGAQPRIPVIGGAVVESRYSSRAGERFQGVGTVDASHPALARVDKFVDVKFYQTVRIDPGKNRVLARLTDQTPLVVESKLGEGRALVFTSTFDNIANDLPLHASFVPFIEQSGHYLSGVDPAPPRYLVDSFVELRAARDQGASVEVIDPSGKRALSLKEAASAQAYRLEQEGFYEIRRANGRHELIAVHADRRESDLDVIPNETLALWQSAGGATSGGPAGEDGTQAYSLWWYFALALTILAVAESLFASRYLSTKEEAPSEARKAAA